MLTEKDYERLISNTLYETEERFVREFTERLTSSLIQGGKLTAKDYRDIEQLAKTNQEALTQLTLKYKTTISKEVKNAINEALSASYAADVGMVMKYGAGIKALHGASEHFNLISDQTARGLASIIERQNLALTTQAERVWYEVAGRAITEYNHGAKTMDAILRQAVYDLSRQGIMTVDYASGIKSQIDVAVKRHVISQAGQAAGRITLDIMERSGHDLVVVSAHFGARPSHAEWQGKIYSRTGTNSKYPDLYTATGYGTVTGLLGVNCRHSMGPYFEGITELPETPEKMNGLTSEDYYKATQKQRGYEREVRAKKREIALLEKSGLSSTQERLELGQIQKRLRNFTGKYNLPRQYAREKAYGIGRQPRALRASKIKKRMSGALHGGNDPSGKRREEHAKKYYAFMRNSSSKAQVKKIAKYNGFTEKEVRQVYDHIFIEKHELTTGYKRFDEDYDMAVSWQRLQQEGNALPHDITMLKHELEESKLMRKGMGYNEAHEKANLKYNYEKELHGYYEDNEWEL